MNVYITLLRGINVGCKNKLPMKELIAILEECGFAEIQTYIQSGNVVLRSKPIKCATAASTIGKAISKKFAFQPQVLMITATDLKKAIENNPFPTDTGKALHFYFLATQPKNPNLDKLESLRAESENFQLVDRVLYLHAPAGIGRSKLAAAIEKNLNAPTTARNWNTVKKLAQMAGIL